jgi:hypothetical protein
MKLDLDIGDIILTGRFKNKAVEVKKFGEDEKGQPTINGRTILKFRIKKLMPVKENKKMSKSRLQQIIREEVANVLNEAFGTWEVEFGRGKVSGVDYYKAGTIKVSARTTVEAIKKATKQAAAGKGNKDDWMAVDIKSLKKV